ncbi:MAG: hypothetical protein ABI473_06670 [Candidatus Dormibacter sp.]
MRYQMGWDERIAQAARLVCQAAVMSEPTLCAGYLATLREIDVAGSSAPLSSNPRLRDDAGTSTARRSALPPRWLAWR